MTEVDGGYKQVGSTTDLDLYYVVLLDLDLTPMNSIHSVVVRHLPMILPRADLIKRFL